MKAKEIMSRPVQTCTPDAPLLGVAKLMSEHDCGSIPIVERNGVKHVIGMVTDRDIVTRALAENTNPLELTAKDCMTLGVATVFEDSDIEDVCNIMEAIQVRRIPVIDADGDCVGIISQGDVAHYVRDHRIANVVRQV